MYIPGGDVGLAALIGEETTEDDPIWPRNEEQVVFTENTQLEDSIIRHRYKELTGAPCPEHFLPSVFSKI